MQEDILSIISYGSYRKDNFLYITLLHIYCIHRDDFRVLECTYAPEYAEANITAIAVVVAPFYCGFRR